MNVIEQISRHITKQTHQKVVEPYLVAIDGHGGSGKSTLVNIIKRTLEGKVVAVVAVDAFIITELVSAWKMLKDHPDAKTPYKIDINRLEKEVLKPLSEGKTAKNLFHKDWWNNEAHGIVIIEGCYSLSEELRNYYDYKIFLDCPLDICLERVSKRDISLGGDVVTAPLLWQEIYFPAENEYMKQQNPKRIADIVIDTTKYHLR